MPKRNRWSLPSSASPQGVTLEICDDGIGFEPGETTADHLGLRIMKERAAAIGADFSIQSSPGQGTTVRVDWKRSSRTEWNEKTK